MKAANSVLDTLHTEHIKVAIDDFGTGFSSLSYLHELHVDLLKIDRSFIKDYPDADDGVILKAMVGMARELGIPVLVEGIETEQQLQLLKHLSLYGIPLPGRCRCVLRCCSSNSKKTYSSSRVIS